MKKRPKTIMRRFIENQWKRDETFNRLLDKMQEVSIPFTFDPFGDIREIKNELKNKRNGNMD